MEYASSEKGEFLVGETHFVNKPVREEMHGNKHYMSDPGKVSLCISLPSVKFSKVPILHQSDTNLETTILADCLLVKT